MLDMLGAVKRLAARGRIAVNDAVAESQLGFDFFAPADTQTHTPSPSKPAAPARNATPLELTPEDAHVAKAAGVPEAKSADVPPARASRGTAARRAQSAMMLNRLHALGLRTVDTVTLMHTRRVMVSLAGRTLRLHEGYVHAPEPVLRAIVSFATARTRAARLAAQEVILAHPVERPAAKRRAETARPGDAPLLARLAEAHHEFNVKHFAGTLSRIPVLLSGRMKTRLGHYSPAGEDGPSAEIVLSRRHLKRDGWAEAMHTLLHEMVHQWQDETSRPLDHGPSFRKKAKEVGVLPRARRALNA